MPSLYYIWLIGLTAGTLVYLFLLALILGHRRPRLLERLLFFTSLALLAIFGGSLLQVNSYLAYGYPPDVTRLGYTAIRVFGFALLPGFAVHLLFAYRRSIRGAAIRTWSHLVIVFFYLAPFLAFGALVRWAFAPGEYTALRGLNLLGVLASVFLIPTALVVGFMQASIARTSKDHIERTLFAALSALSFFAFAIMAVSTFAFRVQPFWISGPDIPLVPSLSFVAAAMFLAGAAPGAVFLYYAVRRNFLEYGAQRNLMYALPVTFLALLYLALVHRVGTWLAPVVPPEATASVLLFALIFLFEPLERVIGPILQRRFQERMGAVQRLTTDLQQTARQGSAAQLISEAERKIRETFGLAAVRISVPRDPSANPLASPGGLGHAVNFPVKKDGAEIGLLEAASTGSFLTGETSASLQVIAEQLPAMIDLSRLIEEKVGLERELAERERLASLGQMAASVSHNLRNPLSSMKTVLQVQLENPDLPVDIRRDCALVVAEIDRMNAKLTQLLRYAKPSVSGERVAAVTLAKQTAVLFRHDAERRNVRLEFEQPSTEVYALASEDSLSEVLSNLIVNAIEAQPSGGRVRVSLARHGERLEIVVEDDGPGISQELRAKIFQPYFTTKPTGTGLGLSIVARRVDEMGGTLACESPLRGGKGARFRLTLPVAPDEGAPVQAAPRIREGL